jgi:pimeloyl-ACP methyl ester carboxylesterase
MTPRTVYHEIAAAGLLLASYPLDIIARPGERLIPKFGRELVVFAHGLGGSRSNFLAFSGYLRLAGFNNFAFFQYPVRQTLGESAEQLEQLIDEKSPDGTAHLIGHSLGGTISRLFASRAPRWRVRSLITIGSPYIYGQQSPRELAIFGDEDPIVPAPPEFSLTPQMFKRSVVLENTGHLAVLYHPETLRVVATELRANRDSLNAR